MKVQILSDLHLEAAAFTFDPADADLCIIAGDVSPCKDDVVAFIRRVEEYYPAILVPGNHEYYPYLDAYGEPIQATDAWYRNTLGTAFYQMDCRIIQGFRVAGCTLWTNFFGRDDRAMRIANWVMTDFSVLLAESNLLFTPKHAADLHDKMRAFLANTKAEIVVTHHAPSRQSIGERFATSDFNGCFANDMEDVITQTGARLWVHGHTHDAKDYVVNGCRVVCNPRGYQGGGYCELTGFNPRLVVEV